MDNLIDLSKIQTGGAAASDDNIQIVSTPLDKKKNGQTSYIFNSYLYHTDIKKMLETMHEFIIYYKKPVVSVGSGNGCLEQIYLNIYGDTNKIICIDPDPVEWYDELSQTDTKNAVGQKYCRNDEVSVDVLLSKRPELKNNCVIFINWSYPNGPEYDYEAIQKLKPLGILLVSAPKIDKDEMKHQRYEHIKNLLEIFPAGTPKLHKYLLTTQDYKRVQLICINNTNLMTEWFTNKDDQSEIKPTNILELPKIFNKTEAEKSLINMEYIYILKKKLLYHELLIHTKESAAGFLLDPKTNPDIDNMLDMDTLIKILQYKIINREEFTQLKSFINSSTEPKNVRGRLRFDSGGYYNSAPNGLHHCY